MTPKMRAQVWLSELNQRDFASELRLIEEEAREVSTSNLREGTKEVRLSTLRTEWQSVRAAQRMRDHLMYETDVI